MKLNFASIFGETVRSLGQSMFGVFPEKTIHYYVSIFIFLIVKHCCCYRPRFFRENPEYFSFQDAVTVSMDLVTETGRKQDGNSTQFRGNVN